MRLPVGLPVGRCVKSFDSVMNDTSQKWERKKNPNLPFNLFKDKFTSMKHIYVHIIPAAPLQS